MHLTRYTFAGYGIFDEYGRLLHGFKDKQSALNANVPENQLVTLYRITSTLQKDDDEIQTNDSE